MTLPANVVRCEAPEVSVTSSAAVWTPSVVGENRTHTEQLSFETSDLPEHSSRRMPIPGAPANTAVPMVTGEEDVLTTRTGATGLGAFRCVTGHDTVRGPTRRSPPSAGMR